MYNLDKEVGKAHKRSKIVNTIYYIVMVLWTIVWYVWIWFGFVKNFTDIFSGAFGAILILVEIDLMLIVFFLWLSRKVGRVKREND